MVKPFSEYTEQEKKELFDEIERIKEEHDRENYVPLKKDSDEE
jgi:hypothetical protein